MKKGDDGKYQKSVKKCGRHFVVGRIARLILNILI